MSSFSGHSSILVFFEPSRNSPEGMEGLSEETIQPEVSPEDIQRVEQQMEQAKRINAQSEADHQKNDVPEALALIGEKSE